MSIWGSLIGGAIGFSFGGPLGMLLGSFIGGRISKVKSSVRHSSFQQNQEIFAISLIVLSAKLSKADGQVSKEEIAAIKDKLKIPKSEMTQVGKIFNKAKEESTGYEVYAEQIAQIFRNNLNVLEEVINIHYPKLKKYLQNGKLRLYEVPIITYCAHSTCNASDLALTELMKKGFVNVSEYNGGMLEYRNNIKH